MKLLLLGGTRFLGRHIAEQALAAGHDLTLLHRGRSGPGLFPTARHIVADRNDGLPLPGAERWDAVIDTNAYVPRHVRQAGQALAGRCGCYLLVSTISVYADFAAGDGAITEDAPLQTLADPATEVVDNQTYGGLKALCEQAAHQAFGDACLVARPGLIVGPHDPTERFTWWVRRAAQGGRLPMPAPAGSALQFIDARDAASWLLRQAEAGTRGCFNLTGPQGGATWQDLATALGPAVQPVWMDEAFLLAQGVAPWTELPLWVPGHEARVHHVDIGRAVATGLQCRPWADTVRDTAAWAAQTPPGTSATGLAAAREGALLAAWDGR